jgi:hypothetical protein
MVTSVRTGAAASALTGTLGFAVASWVVAVRQMNGMDMGVATLPTRAVFDVPLALTIVGLGALIMVAPSSVPGLMPQM